VDPDLRVEIQTYDEDGMSLIGLAVILKNVECEKNGDYELLPGSTIVGGREVHQSSTDWASVLLRPRPKRALCMEFLSSCDRRPKA